MKQSNLGMQFVNSFVRQLGREAAHDAYRSSGNSSNVFTSVVGVSGSTIYSPKNNQSFSLIIWLPFVSLYYLIQGIVMAFSKKPVFQKLVDVLYYKPDRRCTGGARCVGSGTKGGEKFTTTEWSDDELKAYRSSGYNIILTSLVVITVKILIPFTLLKLTTI